VQKGVYNGNLSITKRLILTGIGHPVIRGDGSGSVITILADSCVIRGFNIEHGGKMLVNEDAGILVKSRGNRLEENAVRDVLFGMYFFHADNNIARNNLISGRKELGLGERGSGIHIWNSHANIFVKNAITDVRDGFYIQNANRMLIEDNEVWGVRYGLHYMYADSNTFIGNKFHDNVAGAAIMYSKNILMRRNLFTHNRGFSSFGILLQDCHHSLADSNIIGDNVTGLFFEASTDNLFRHNVIAQNDDALQMFQNSTNNTITENNFIDNLNPLVLVGKRTDTRWSSNGKGNYWSSYDGYDLDGDGAGDVPMKIQNAFQYLEGRNTNVRLYLYSPVSQAVAAATTAFPIIDINQETDEHPLMKPVELQSLAHIIAGRRPGIDEGVSLQSLASIRVAGPMTGFLIGLILVIRTLRKGIA
jgi:nitrous oxidase accessory protein